MCAATVFNVLGVIPGVGVPIGIGRICYAIKQSRQERVNAVGEAALAAIKRTTHREIFHGFCEIIPLLGPLLYGAIKLYQRCAKKTNNQAQNILGAANGALIAPPAMTPVPTPQGSAQSSVLPGSIPATAPTPGTVVSLASPAAPVQPPIAKIIPMPASISLEGITTCASLVPHIGKKIAINVFPKAVPKDHLKDLKKIPEVLIYEGVLKNVAIGLRSSKTTATSLASSREKSAAKDKLDDLKPIAKNVSGILANGKHVISLDPVTCRIPDRLQAGPVDLTVTDAELAAANKADQELEVEAKGLSELLGED